PAGTREAAVQRRRRVARESRQGLEIALHRGDALVPVAGVVWRVARGPVACGPLRGGVFRALREFHDVPLRDADVFVHTPGGEGLPRGFGAPDLGRPVGDRVLEGDMGVTPIEQLDEMVAERALGTGATRFALDSIGGSVSLRRACDAC